MTEAITIPCKVCGKPSSGRRGSCCSAECHREFEREYSRQHRAKFSPERKRATSMVSVAVVRGDLKRQPCETCAAEFDTHAHHDDYAKPLEVRWLCGGCHRKHHVKHGPGKNAYAS